MRSRSMSPRGTFTWTSPPRSWRAAATPGSRRRHTIRAATARCFRAGDRAESEEIADLEIAAIAGVMRDHLRDGPVEKRGRGLRQAMRRHAVAAHRFGCEIGFERDVESALRTILRIVEMRQRR